LRKGHALIPLPTLSREILFRIRGKTVIPAKPVPACFKQGAGIQILEIIIHSNCLDARFREHDELQPSLRVEREFLDEN